MDFPLLKNKEMSTDLPPFSQLKRVDNAPLIAENSSFSALIKDHINDFNGKESFDLKNKFQSKDLKQVSKDLEAFFIQYMFQKVMDKMPKQSLLGEAQSFRESLYTDMLHQEYTNLMSKTSDFGLAQVIYDQLV